MTEAEWAYADASIDHALMQWIYEDAEIDAAELDEGDDEYINNDIR